MSNEGLPVDWVVDALESDFIKVEGSLVSGGTIVALWGLSEGDIVVVVETSSVGDIVVGGVDSA